MPKTIIISIEKIHHLRRFLEVIHASEDIAFPPQTKISFVNQTSMGFYGFEHPTGLTYADFPFVSEPRRIFRPPLPNGEGIINHYDPSTGSLHRVPVCTESDIKRLLGSADVILNSNDPDLRGCRTFTQTIAGASLKTPNIFDAQLWSLDDAAIKAVLKGALKGSLSKFSLSHPCVLAAQAKDFFDYNWMINNSSVIARYLAHVGCPSSVGKNTDDEIPISSPALFQKGCLNLLLALARNPTAFSGNTGSDIVSFMITAKMGSPTSRFTILDNLTNLGLLAHTDGDTYSLTDMGYRLSESLPKDAYDPHMMRRLEEWQDDWPTSKPKMERYLNVYWGKLKRKASTYEFKNANAVN